jgi:CheY-like chemotaxis protein
MDKRPLVLIAEDDESLRTSLEKFLESEGYDVIATPNGAAALQKIRSGNRRPDLILLDLRMPILNGWEFLAVREGDPVLLLIPVIVLSGEEKQPKPDLGPVVYVTKPVDFAQLGRAVAETLEEAMPDPERLPRASEPWSIHDERPNVIRNRFGRIIAYVRSQREARRLVAAVNGTSRISTEALETGIVDKGLECLYQLNRYDTDQDFKAQLDAETGITSIVARRAEIAALLRTMAFGV